jgi:hypothetical protein
MGGIRLREEVNVNQPPATTADTLYRLGTYRIEEKPWTNTAPSRGATGEELRRFWLKLLRYHADQLELRHRPCECGGNSPSHVQWKYGQKIEIKVHESVIELLHRIIAPGAPFLCDHACPHVDKGATPEQLRRFLDSIDAHAALCRENAEHGHSMYGTYEQDQAEEAEIMGECRRHLEEATGLVFPPSAAPAGWPPARRSASATTAG